jgi:hypothetical protein
MFEDKKLKKEIDSLKFDLGVLKNELFDLKYPNGRLRIREYYWRNGTSYAEYSYLFHEEIKTATIIVFDSGKNKEFKSELYKETNLTVFKISFNKENSFYVLDNKAGVANQASSELFENKAKWVPLIVTP